MICRQSKHRETACLSNQKKRLQTLERTSIAVYSVQARDSHPKRVVAMATSDQTIRE